MDWNSPNDRSMYDIFGHVPVAYFRVIIVVVFVAGLALGIYWQ